MHICIIDDSNSARFLATKVLRELGYKNVTVLDSAEAGIEKLKTEKFDLILLDWNMGGMSGLDFLKYLRQPDRENEKTAVIMVTTVNEKSNVIQALKVGVQGYIFKPITAASAGPKIKEIETKLIAGQSSRVSP